MTEFRRAEILSALDELSKELGRGRQRAHIHMVGGAAMIMLYGRQTVTGNIDESMAQGHGPVIEAVRKIAVRRGWPSTWLNHQAAMYRPRAGDPDPRPLFSSPSLVVLAGSPEYMLAMKLQAARGTDARDIRRLLNECGVATVQEALTIHDRLFPDRPAGGHQRRMLEMILTGRSPHPNDELPGPSSTCR